MEWQHSAVRKCFIKLSWISFNARISSMVVHSTSAVHCTTLFCSILFFPANCKSYCYHYCYCCFIDADTAPFPSLSILSRIVSSSKTIFPKWTCQTWYKSTDLGLYFVNKFFKGSCFQLCLQRQFQNFR